jgi:polyhydroxyalkanoate synthesis regulator phasin
MNPVHEFTVMWATRPEARDLRAIHHTMVNQGKIENEDTTTVSETVVRPVRELLSRVECDESREAVHLLDCMITVIKTKQGFDRSTEVSTAEVARVRELCDKIANQYSMQCESEGKELLPMNEIEVPAIVARGKKDRENQRGKLRIRE